MAYIVKDPAGAVILSLETIGLHSNPDILKNMNEEIISLFDGNPSGKLTIIFGGKPKLSSRFANLLFAKLDKEDLGKFSFEGILTTDELIIHETFM